MIGQTFMMPMDIMIYCIPTAQHFQISLFNGVGVKGAQQVGSQNSWYFFTPDVCYSYCMLMMNGQTNRLLNN